ncbi:MAG: DUF5309 domain-containing protein [Candidatus Aenigmarchaeota archaeon]|nr:DUF5309 domain-containing protein [Candidatus Aenigmarchaeota archaeon]
MRINKGQYGKSTLVENSLAQNLLLFPQISKKIIREFPQYSLTYFTEGLGRYADEKIIGGNAFEWWIQGRLSRPQTATGTTSGTGVSGTPFTVEFKENFANKADILRFENGEQALITSSVQTAGGYTYTMVLQTADATATFTAANAAAGKQSGVIGNAHTESSEKGYGNLVYPDKYINYLSICRQAGEISGSAMTDVTWVESGGQRLWYFTAESQIREKFMYEMELKRWYDKISVDSNGNPTMYADGKPVYTGDGLLAQIDGGNMATYVPPLTEKEITNFLADLRYTNGETNAKYLVFTGTAGLREFQQAMKDFYITDGSVLYYDADMSDDIKLGGDFLSYKAMGLTMTLVHNPLFDDPNLHHDLAPDGLPKESYKMVFVNFGVLPEGVSNLEMLVKGAEGINRGFIVKYIDGMVNPFNQNSMTAANSKDAFSVEYMSHTGVVLRRPKSCGILQYG